MDDDERQEYECLLLEGHTPEEARLLARSANDRINSRRLSGPTTGDTRHGHGQRPLVSDMRLYVEDVKSLGQDCRTPEEREADEQLEALADEILSWLAPRQRELVVNKFGIGVEPATSDAELAARLGVTKNTVRSSMATIRNKILAIHAMGGPEQWKNDYMARRYEGGNQGRKARYPVTV